MAHHVVEHAAALQLALPEPGRVRTAVLLGGAREVGAPSELRAARPQEIASGFDLRRKQLILEIAVRQADLVHELEDPLCLVDIARERLLTGDSLELPFAALERAHHLFDVLDARVVWA